MIFFNKRPDIAESLAAIDLGSNSFHLLIAQRQGNSIRIVDHMKEPVRLSADLDSTGSISEAARERAIACLEKFGQRTREIPSGWVRAVGTNVFRKADNAESFLREAEAALGHSIDIVSGPEEARLIYLGVTHGIDNDSQHRLVFDIGGSSSELIYGIGNKPQRLESFDIGCVTMTSKVFADGQMSAKRFRKAEIIALSELDFWKQSYPGLKYDLVVGTSGTIRTLDRLLTDLALSKQGITASALDQLRDFMVSLTDTDTLAKQLKIDKYRAQSLPGGLAILRSLFSALRIDTMQVSDKAMRQGLIYDMTGDAFHDDIREQSINRLADKFEVEKAHVARVQALLDNIYGAVCGPWNMDDENIRNLLRWAAQTHEIGLYISHTQFHKHGAYVLENTDLLGFSRQEQKILALLLRCQRKKLPQPLFEGFDPDYQDTLYRMIAVLRLSVILNRNRSDNLLPEIRIEAPAAGQLLLVFPDDWLAAHPLTLADLEYEATALKGRITLEFR